VGFRFTAAHWALLAALAALYTLAGKLGLHFAFVHASATAVWPPTGIALAAFLLFGPRCGRRWRWAPFWSNVTTAGSVATSLGVAAGKHARGAPERVAGQPLRPRPIRFERAQDIFAFVVAVVPGALSVHDGVASLALGGYRAVASFGPIWGHVWLGISPARSSSRRRCSSGPTGGRRSC